jgi:hypothetical protein
MTWLHLVRGQRDELMGDRQMLSKTAFQWPLQPSTIIGLGVLAGSLCYVVTGDPVWAAVTAAAVKILVPDNSTSASQALEAITMLTEAIGKCLDPSVHAEPIASRDTRPTMRAVEREAAE